MNKHIMMLSTNRHVGLDLQAELDDARAEIEDLIGQNIRLRANVDKAVRDSLRRQREHYEKGSEHYEKEIAYLKQVARIDMGEVYNRLGAEHFKVMDPTGHDARVMGYTPAPPLPPPPASRASLNQQAAQTNPYAIA